MKCAEHVDRLDCRQSELRRDVVGNAGEAEHADLQHLSRREHAFEVGAADVLQAEHERATG